MKTRLFALLFSVVTVLLSGCANVLVKKPAGDKPATLNPEHWEGNWVGADGISFTSKLLKDTGLIEVKNTSPGENEEIIHVQVRDLKDRLVGTVVPKPGEKEEEEGAAFFRIVATENHIAVFMPVEDVFKKAVRAGTIAGKVKEAKKQPEGTISAGYDITSLDHFDAAELDKLALTVKGSLLECFDPDPAMVFVREKKPGKSGGTGEKDGPSKN